MSNPNRAHNILTPFMTLLGWQLLSAQDGVSEVLLTLRPEHLNTWAVAHGGVTMTLADVALATAAHSLSDDGVGVVTIEMKVTFMQPGIGELRAIGRVLHRSTSMAYCEGDIRDSEKRLVAKALGTLKYTRRLADGHEVRPQIASDDAAAKKIGAPTDC
ncbi:PaaI family thioesterase [Caballeronia sp. 15711]|uniref:PaaI family thioesterase n=1 Tax=Caballeronia sp. 15711 TaxID=3391029 RepID=UPI0039E6D99C